MSRQLSIDDPEPHGQRPMFRHLRDLMADQPRWAKRFGRAAVTAMIGGCEECATADRAAARRRQQRTLYRRKQS